MAVRGSCLRGGVTFEIDRAWGPSSLLTIRVNTQDFRLLKGKELVKSYACPILYSRQRIHPRIRPQPPQRLRMIVGGAP